MCIYIYIYIYIQTSRKYPVPSSSFYSFLLTARGALTVSRGGSYARGLIRLVRLGLDPWRYQVAKSVFSAGPDLGSFSSQRSALGTDPIWVRKLQAFSLEK